MLERINNNNLLIIFFMLVKKKIKYVEYVYFGEVSDLVYRGF